jgi:hypothetical protein
MPASRRKFIKSLSAGAVLLAIPSVIGGQERSSKPVASAAAAGQSYPDFDVIVVGAGASGFPAAMAAARNGANVALLEEDQVPGGAPVDMYVTYLCGGPVAGFYKDFITELSNYHTLGGVPSATFNPVAGKDSSGARWWQPSSYVQVIKQIIDNHNSSNAAQITLICNARVTGVIVDGQVDGKSRVRGVQAVIDDAAATINGKVVIDATGIGEVAEKAGCEVMFGVDAMSDFNEPIGSDTAQQKIMPCTWMFITHRSRKGGVLPFFAGNSDSGAKLLYGGCIEDREGWIEDASYIARDSGTYAHWGIGLNGVDTRNTADVGRAQSEMFKKITDRGDLDLIRSAGFEIEFAPKIGIRECRRIRGEFVMTVNELGIVGTPYYNDGFVPHDMIAEASYYIDAWGMDPPIDDVYKKTTPYGIPYRSLIPLHVEGLLTAGRIISGTHLAMSSYRVQPIAASIGYGAGTAAAMAALNYDGVVRSVDGAALKQKLSGEGFFSNRTVNENK